MRRPRTWYEYGDRLYKKAEIRIEKIFRRARLLLPYDQINQMGGAEITRTYVYNLYRRLKKVNRECFEDIYEYVYVMAYEEAKGEKPKKIPRKRVDLILKAYNPVTKYVYIQECERKQSRMFEALMADAGKYYATEDDFKKAKKYWLNMTKQYFIEAEDDASKDAYNDAGLWRVRWMTEQDDRVCLVCRERHGRKYTLDKVPPKPHWNCRCWLVPIGGA